MITSGLMSSFADDWGTPQKLFDELNVEFGFTVDVCADATNFKVANYFDVEVDGLAQVWEGVCWMNPPYGRTIKLWMAKAVEAWRDGATVVCLVPARTDTAWWHDFVGQADEVRFLRGRLKFERDRVGVAPAPFPSAIVIFRGQSVE